MAAIDTGVKSRKYLAQCDLRSVTLLGLAKKMRNVREVKVGLAEVAIMWETIQECREQFGA